MNIAMWSGPRNLSTAMMYAFAQRSDCMVVDEPFYAAYLAATGLDHPMREEVLARQSQSYQNVITNCVTKPSGSEHVYQKHMTHHILADTPLDWLSQVSNVFLIRHPARVVASYDKKRENPTLSDIGFAQQWTLYEYVKTLGIDPIVLDSADVRDDPRAMISALCNALGIPFDPGMLRWEPGGIPEDGVWAKHWYNAVHNSNGFAGAEGPLPVITGALAKVVDDALPIYEEMRAKRLKAS